MNAPETPQVAVEPIAQLTELIRAKLPADQAPAAAEFARQYYGQVAPEDLAEYPLDDLYGAALSHWHFARTFSGGAPKLRVFNPRLDEHGWQSTHTIIEIVNHDMPFLVDSITMEVNRQGLTLHLIVHPVMKIRRDAAHRLVGLALDRSEPDGRFESLIHVEVDRCTDAGKLAALHDGLLRILGDVRAAVEDWKQMRQAVLDVVAGLERNAPPPASGDVTEDLAFLHWLADDNFTLLGFRDYDLLQDNGGDALRVVADSGLGILRVGDEPGAASASFAALSAEVRARARSPQLLLLTKSNNRSTVHRPGWLDYIGVKRFDAQGAVCGERRFVGLYTSTAYSTSPAEIPLLRRKVAAVTARAGFLPKSHAAKALATVFEQYPRDELFQIDDDELYAAAMGILRLGERQRTRLFVRHDAFERFVSCLVYVPRENYNTDLRARIQALLMAEFNGTSSEFSVQFSDSPLARLLIVVRTPSTAPARRDVREIEQRLVGISRGWTDELRSALLEATGEERGNALYERYAAGFGPGYRDDHAPRVAVRDIEMMEALDGPGPAPGRSEGGPAPSGGSERSERGGPDSLGLSLYLPLEAPPGRLRLELFRAGQLAPLSQSLPMIEHMGVQVLEERPYEVKRADGTEVWIDDFGLVVPGADEIDIERLRAPFHEAFLRTWRGQNENDDFNRLVMLAGLDWRGVTVLRAYAKYMKQAAFTFSQAYIQQALAAHPRIAKDLVALFIARFDPALVGPPPGRSQGGPAPSGGSERSERGGNSDRQTKQDEITARIAEALDDDVSNLDEDRILRQYLAVIQATLRTNFFQRGTDGGPKPVLSFKFDPSKVPGLPEPKPLFEIFVYSPRVEGVHLRGGKIARGGLRWSDRMEDFRTEVLGLVKAQQVKNAVIVPVGSKGGFVLQRPPAAGDRDALMKEGIACYQAYLRGLLDVTDNLVQGAVVPPRDVVRHDPDDPYLVVAADKGTATFSDTANAVAAEYGFWLGDAFASGGSAGYDHKKMAITARGAWESVKRHFRGLGHDTQTQEFTVAGVGDMSGDVFGNGMLLSRHIRLVAAFDHRHIFIDPNPDAASSFAERERLFALPRSSWADYDATKISAGGGVWPRGAKSIAIAPQVRAALGIEGDVPSMTPAELMHAILLAPVDLFYNGGIGTYVKSSAESHADCGDRANDAIRVNGAELRCKVVAEGGNLGCTQRGRIEYALKGGLGPAPGRSEGGPAPSGGSERSERGGLGPAPGRSEGGPAPSGGSERSERGGLINTDAIDNSAGVDCSDHEVNIKILLNAVVGEGEMTAKQRDKLLAEMTDDVAALVLRDNCFQNQVLAVNRSRAHEMLDEQARYMRHLSSIGRLNRRIEFLPSDDVLAERRQAGLGLTTPELAVVLAYSKMELFDLVIASDVPEDPTIATTLERYFPKVLRERFPAQMRKHALRREIIATHVVNSMVNRVGPTFTHALHEETGAAPADIVRAYIGVRQVFDLVPLWVANEALDNVVDAATQDAVVLATVRAITRGTVWLLHQRDALRDLGATIGRYAPGVAEVGAGLERWLSADEQAVVRAEASRLVERGVPEALAQRVARLDAQVAGLDIVEVGAETGLPVEVVAGVYFGVGGRLELGWLSQQIERVPVRNTWQGLAKVAMRGDLTVLARSLARSVLAEAAPASVGVADRLAAWEAKRRFGLERSAKLIAELKPLPALDMAMLSVLLRELRGLV